MPLNLFAIIIGLGATAGLASATWKARDLRETSSMVTATLILLAGGLVGGRIGFGVINWPYFQAHLWELPQIWLGGFSGPGAIAGMLLTIPVGARLMRLRFSTFIGWLFPLLPPVAVSAWLACWVTGVAYGSPVTSSFIALLARDEWGVYLGRFPLQLVGALLSLVLFALIESWSGLNRQPWRKFSLGVLAAVLPATGLSFLRADSTPLWAGLRPDTWGFLCLSLVAFLLLASSFLPSVNEN